MPGGARTQLTYFAEPVSGASYEPTQGRYFLFTRDTGGNEFSQIYRYDISDGTVTLLTDGGRSQNGNIVWSHKGDRIAFTSTRRNGADRDIYVMDPMQPTAARMVLQMSGGGGSVTDWSPDDSTLLAAQFTSVTKSDLFLVDVASGGRTDLTGSGAQVSHVGGEFSPDGRSVFLTADEGSEFSRLSVLDMATRKVTPLVVDIPWDVDDFDLSQDGKTIAFVTNEAGVSRLRLLDVATRRACARRGRASWRHREPAFPSVTGELGFTTGSARATSDVYSLDPTNGQVTRWTESETRRTRRVATGRGRAHRVEVASTAARSRLLLPPAATVHRERPVIIDIHGGPEGQSRPASGDARITSLNELGVAMIYPNVRGSTGYGKTFSTLDNGQKREDSVKDIGALLDWIAQQPDLDADRVMVTGGSYGGYMALASLTHYSDRIRCAASTSSASPTSSRS